MTEPTRDEINKILAEKVMGWSWGVVHDEPVYFDRNNIPAYNADIWNPFGNVEQAFQVLEKMEQDGWRATIYAGAQEKSCVVLRFHEAYHRYGQKVSEGICNAVYAAIAKEGEK